MDAVCFVLFIISQFKTKLGTMACNRPISIERANISLASVKTNILIEPHSRKHWC